MEARRPAREHRIPRFLRLRGRARRVLFGNVFILGVVSLVWLLLRSGRKPSRLAYPCQQAALTNTSLLFGGGVVPLAARLGRALHAESAAIAEGDPDTRMRCLRVLEAASLFLLAGLLAASLLGSPGGPRLTVVMKAAAAGLDLPELRSDSPRASAIYVAEGIPANSERGVDTLIDVMARNGLDLFRSASAHAASGPQGIIGSDDIVLIKVNGEWRYRGGTNTDVVKGLVNAIVHHPDGFRGEVVIVENGQWDSYMDNRPDNRNPDACNAEDRGQSFNDVAMMFAADHRVSVYDWTAIQTLAVGEFASGDMRDGYVYVPEIQLGYPKFTTVYGTRISLRYGEWTGTGYDNGKVKFINLPVLKDHGGPGVTNALKHFMGVQDLYQGTQNPPHGPMVSEGILAKLMLVARYPDLNISDAIWVCPAGGPNAPYDRAVRVDRLLASRDPVALDYYCGKYVLMPISGNPRHDPDGDNQFHQMLASSRDVLAAGGKQATMDEGEMNVYKGSAPDVPPPMPCESFLAEGCTDYGFETWVLVANPHDRDAEVRVSYYTEEGCRNAAPVTVPAHSRLTLNASATIWAKSSGVRVGSDLPVFVERAMYWNGRREGHSAAGVSEGSLEWHLAEGCTDHGFESWVTLLNPGAKESVAELRFLGEKTGERRGAVTVPPYTRMNVKVNDWVGADNVSTVISADEPVVAEISMYGPGRRSGTCSMGVTAPGKEWYLAEGATHSGFHTWLLLMNPGAEKAEVEVRVDAPGGGLEPLVMEVAPRARGTLHLNELLPGRDLSMTVRSQVPVVASRSVYWEVPGGRAGHECQGNPAPAREVFLAEGCTAYGFDTWLLLYNPGAVDAVATVYAMTESGEREIGKVEVAARGRSTVRVADLYQGSLSMRVLADEPICCERATYWSQRGGGTCSPGQYP